MSLMVLEELEGMKVPSKNKGKGAAPTFMSLNQVPVFSEAMSMTKRYFTSLLSMRS